MSKSSTATLFALALTLAAGNADAKPALALGAEAPLAATRMRNVDGEQIAIADVAGDKGTLVIFTCNHCPYVKAWDERIAALGNEYVKKGIGVIAINSNDPKKHDEDRFEVMVEQSKRLGHRFPYVVDTGSKVARAFGATRTPEIFLFDAGGKLVYRGAVDDNYADASKVTQRFLRDALEAVIANAAIPVAETKALGCSIKLQD